MTDNQQLVAETALRDMVRKGFFSICVIDEILRMTCTIPDGDSYRMLRMLHCMNFMDMPPKLLAELPGLLRAVLNGPSLQFGVELRLPQRAEIKRFEIVEEPTPASPTPEAKATKQNWLISLLR